MLKWTLIGHPHLDLDGDPIPDLGLRAPDKCTITARHIRCTHVYFD
jgi:hypothetical protein